MRAWFFCVFAILHCFSPCVGADLTVDPDAGNDSNDGQHEPLRTIAAAIRIARPGDTIHLQPKVYRDWAWFLDKSGEANRPITLDGHGAVLDGCDPLDATNWTEVEPGLYQNSDLMPLTDAIIDRWFFVIDGKINRMQRCSKGPSVPLKEPYKLQPGEWTFVKDEQRTTSAKPGYIFGSFWLKLPPGQKLSSANCEYPSRMAGVAIQGNSHHLVIRNLTSTRPYNDGFNLSDCKNVAFENIRAINCGDDGISAHGACDYQVIGFESAGNATGICDTGDSRTSYDNVSIHDCVGFDLYFLDTGTYRVSNARIRSTAARPLYLLGREDADKPCEVTLENVLLEHSGGIAEVRVSPATKLTVRHSTFVNLDWQATGGVIAMEDSVIQGVVPETTARNVRLHLWPHSRWQGNRNCFAFEQIRVGDKSFSPAQLSEFRDATDSDRDSRWSLNENGDDQTGADRRRLPKLER